MSAPADSRGLFLLLLALCLLFFPSLWWSVWSGSMVLPGPTLESLLLLLLSVATGPSWLRSVGANTRLSLLVEVGVILGCNPPTVWLVVVSLSALGQLPRLVSLGGVVQCLPVRVWGEFTVVSGFWGPFPLSGWTCEWVVHAGIEVGFAVAVGRRENNNGVLMKIYLPSNISIITLDTHTQMTLVGQLPYMLYYPTFLSHSWLFSVMNHPQRNDICTWEWLLLMPLNFDLPHM